MWCYLNFSFLNFNNFWSNSYLLYLIETIIVLEAFEYLKYNFLLEGMFIYNQIISFHILYNFIIIKIMKITLPCTV